MKSLHFKGAIFDLDGVITQTAKQHFKAWKKTFEEFLKENCEDKQIKFTYKNDYIPYVDGKPRYQGVKSFMESRDIELPFGTPHDDPKKNTICGIGNRKNKMFRSLISEDGVETFDSTIKLVKKLKDYGIKIGVASSSKNCRYVLKETGLIDHFETVVGGIVSKELDLNGKPDPDIFTLAAENLGVKPYNCFMVEDAISGVQAGKRGNFGLVIGVNREGEKREMLAQGADIVVDDMDELSLEDIDKWFEEELAREEWNLTYHKFEPDQEKLRETLTTVGNGYFGTRGCFVNNKADEVVHYPGTYIAGLYNKLPSMVYRKKIVNKDFVNCPNWLLIKIQIGDDEQSIDPLHENILDYEHTLNMQDGIVSRMVIFEDTKGRKTKIETSRFANMKNPHQGCIKYEVTPKNYSANIKIHSTLDGDIINYGVPRYRELNSRHLSPITVGKDENGCIFLKTETVNSDVKIFMKAKHNLLWNEKECTAEREFDTSSGVVTDIFTIEAVEGSTYSLDKLTSIYTSKDEDVKSPSQAFEDSLTGEETFDNLKEEHVKEWHQLWDKADYQIEGDRFTQKAVRLHIYHLLTTASLNNKHIDAGMPARGLHGEAYRGHIFWDELFIYPFYNIHFPEITKSLLMYRYKRLDAARRCARENGYEGAMYPWQTADDGKEETQEIHFNPMSGKWDPDYSRLQRHVSIAVVYNVWEYFYLTNDEEFLIYYGLEIMLEVARFWASIAEYDKDDERYHIKGVMGPDEFHEKYPDAEEGGLKDNAYTNIMVSWILHKVVETYEYRSDEVKNAISKKIGLYEAEIEKWKDIVRNLNVVFKDEGIISQFEGYMDLKEIDWEYYREKYDNIRRMDRILKAEGDSPDKYKLAKQADVLMTFYMLSPGQVKHILNMMDYDIKDGTECLKKNYEYYIKRTSHGSTLSYVVHAAILTYLHEHKHKMWDWFLKAMKSDIYDTQGGTTPEGIHTGVMAGSIDIIFAGFAGINIFKDHLQIDPFLPTHWEKLSFKMLYKGNWLVFEIDQNKVKIRALEKGKDIYFKINENKYEMEDGNIIKAPFHNSF
ncbi:MAG: beta-phosphoglucomutase family hydrolase [Candidatus Cloacimonetes bacterium]|nr:beta-phosphoglucomutase family hydrolase [Candidatus Cloacimonadota bacterium]MBS3767583.1 beta-phosphoglucomutase family hydrolase [Candidatus Cloacimonadota bacterium]